MPEENERVDPEEVLEHCKWLAGRAFNGNAQVVPLSEAKIIARRVLDLEQQLGAWKTCNTCGGSPHASGVMCICGGTGSSSAELDGLRRRCLELEQKLTACHETVRISDESDKGLELLCDKLEEQLAEARKLIERVRNNPAQTPWDEDASKFLESK